VPDESEMWANLYCDMVFHAFVRVMNTPGVMSPGLTGRRTRRMSVIGLHQSAVCTRIKSLRVLACLCPVQVTGQAGDAACCVVLVNHALARGHCESALRGGYGRYGLFRRRVGLDRCTCVGNPVSSQCSDGSISCCFSLSDPSGLRCGHYSSVLLRKNPAPCAGSRAGPLYMRTRLM